MALPFALMYAVASARGSATRDRRPMLAALRAWERKWAAPLAARRVVLVNYE